MKYSSKKILLIVVLSAICTLATSEEKSSKTKLSRYQSSKTKASLDTGTKFKFSDAYYAGMWNITQTDWRRYKSLMSGPRGFWSPQLDPLTVLGVHARSEAERRRIALIQIKMEQQRLEDELAYDQTFYQVGREYFGTKVLIDLARLKQKTKAGQRLIQKNVSQLQIGDRLLLFVSLKQCSLCNQTGYQVLEQVRGKKGIGVDIFFVGASRKDKNKIQAWAKKLGISAIAIRHGNVSLNYDRGTFAQLRIQKQTLPVLLRKRGTHLQIVAH